MNGLKVGGRGTTNGKLKCNYYSVFMVAFVVWLLKGTLELGSLQVV